jgi:hypothetical protein
MAGTRRKSGACRTLRIEHLIEKPEVNRRYKIIMDR